MKTTYWTTKNGNKINIDDMSIEHLRNALKIIVNQNKNIPKNSPCNINQAFDMEDIEEESDLGRVENYTLSSIAFSDSEIKAITNKSQYQIESEDNFWK